MTIPRKQQICLETTRYYHCTTRCVRRGFLCGYDEFTQTDFGHRRSWLEQRLHQVASVYCIKLSSYAIMHNHYHAVLYVDKEQALSLTSRQVIERWSRLYHLPSMVKRAYARESLSKAERHWVSQEVKKWRERLFAVDWFMKEVNQFIARKANREDEVTGHFWDGRYDSQSLVGEKGLLCSMVYDDLNPVRAGIADTPEESEYTSLIARINRAMKPQSLPCMHPFLDQVSDQDQEAIPFSFTDYLELVDWTGRQIRADKGGYIDAALPPILERLNLSQADWLAAVKNIKRPRAVMVGTKQEVKLASIKKGRKRASGYFLPD